MKFQHWIAQAFNALEKTLSGSRETGTFCHGAGPMMADACLVPQIFNAKRIDMDLTPYATLMRIFENCMRLPAFDLAQPSKQPDAQ